MDKVLENGHVEVLDGPGDESYEIDLTDRADRVNVSGGA